MASSSLGNINLDYLLRNAPTMMVRRGSLYFHEGRASVAEAESDQATVLVEGSRGTPYEVVITLHHDTTDYLTLQCDCPYAYESPGEWCKHKVAAILQIRDHFRAVRVPSWREVLDQAIACSPVSTRATRTILVFSLQEGPAGWQILPYCVPHMPSVSGEGDDIEALADIIESRGLGERARVPRTLSSGDTPAGAAPPHIAAARMLLDAQAHFHNRDRVLGAVLPLLPGALLYRGNRDNPLAQRVRISEAPAQAVLELHAAGGGLRLEPAIRINGNAIPLRLESPPVICDAPLWVLAGGVVAPIDGSPGLLSVLRRYRDLTIPEADQEAFVEYYLSPLAHRVALAGDGLGEWQDVQTEPVRRLYLSDASHRLDIEIRFGYDHIELPYDAAYPEVSLRRAPAGKGICRVLRSPTVEREAFSALSSHGLKRAQPPGRFSLRQAVGPADFLIHHLPRLAAAGYEVYGEERLKAVRVNRSRPTISFSVSSGIDWFDLHAEIRFGDTSASLREVRKAVRKRERYVKLLDGSIGELPEDWLRNYRYMFDLGKQTEEGLRFGGAQAMILDSVLDAADQARLDSEFHTRLSRLRGFSAIETKAPPGGFSGELRPYQQHGYDWLHFLRDYRFGGCLADDMGLGKTIQALAFVQSLREGESARQATLVVVRRSLLTNWQREAARFAPGLKVLLHTEGSRQQDEGAFEPFDLVLTTYGIMRRDIEMLKKRSFRCIILDESQTIKNPESITARAARQLQGLHRIALTGTPVENSTVELWSQFAFLNPGLLGSLDYFRREFAAPIERRNDEPAAEYLRSLVHPFILRRTKEQVAPELPARTERIVLCDLDSTQRKLYEQYRQRYRSMLLGLIEEKGISGARMRVLEGLLRLRQICIHPLLVERGYKGEAAKMDVLLETLETLMSEGHKALVFSQFTQMLRLVQVALKERGITHQYLDGQTRNRQERIDAFQADTEMPFFLISLKAGGVGLNLTAADYVIHIDPWWNPAVERQASDRTHRIGQEKPVFVHKLIARDTVEEKMLDLQERKRALVDRLVASENAFFKSLTAGDVQALFS